MLPGAGGRPDRVSAVSFRVVVLVSGSGTLLQALIDAQVGRELGAEVVAVGSDRPGCGGLTRAERAGIPRFVQPLERGADRAEWDARLADRVAAFSPDLVVCAGYMKLFGRAFLDRYAGGRIINSHPALLPAFPGVHGVRDALDHGVKVTGASIILVDAGVDTGVIIDQVAVPVADGDTEETLHERIKLSEQRLLTETVRRMAGGNWHVDGRRFRWDGSDDDGGE